MSMSDPIADMLGENRVRHAGCGGKAKRGEQASKEEEEGGSILDHFLNRDFLHLSQNILLGFDDNSFN